MACLNYGLTGIILYVSLESMLMETSHEKIRTKSI